MLHFLMAAVMFGAVAEEESLLRLVPPGAQLLVSVESVKGLRETADESAWARFLKDPEMEPVIDFVFSELQEEIEGDETFAALNPLKLLEIVHGSAVVYAAVESFEEERFSCGLLLEPGEDRDAFDEYLDQFKDFLYSEEEAMSSFTDTYEGVELEIFEAMDDEEVSGGFLLAETDGVVFFLANKSPDRNLETAHGLIDAIRGEGEGESILDSHSFQHAREKTGGPGDVELYIDLGSMLSRAPLEEVPEFVGIQALKVVHFRIELGSGEELDVIGFIGIEGEGLIREFVDLLMGEAPTELFASMPANAMSVSATYLDLNGILKKALALFQELAGEEYNEFRNIYEEYVVKRMGVDPEKDLIELLDGRIAAFDMEIPPEESEVLESLGGQGSFFGISNPGLNLGSITLFGVSNAEAFRSNLVKMLRALGVYVSLKKEDFQGQIVHSILIPMLGVRIYWTFTEDLFCLTFFPSTIRSLVRMRAHGDQPSAKDREEFAGFLEAHEEGMCLSLAETKNLLKSFLIGFTSTMEDVRITVGISEGEEDPPDLPDMDIVDKYFEGVTCFFQEVDEEGILSGVKCR